MITSRTTSSSVQHEEIQHRRISLFCEFLIPGCCQVHGIARVAHHLSVPVNISMEPKGEVACLDFFQFFRAPCHASTIYLLQPTPKPHVLVLSICSNEKESSDAMATTPLACFRTHHLLFRNLVPNTVKQVFKISISSPGVLICAL